MQPARIATTIGGGEVHAGACTIRAIASPDPRVAAINVVQRIGASEANVTSAGTSTASHIGKNRTNSDQPWASKRP